MKRLLIGLLTAAALITAAFAGLDGGDPFIGSRTCIDRSADDQSPAASPAILPEPARWGCDTDDMAGSPPQGPRITAC